MQISLDSIVEKGAMAVVSLFAGGAYVHWRNEPRLQNLESAMWGTKSDDGVVQRTKSHGEALAEIGLRQTEHDGLLRRVADDVQEIKNYIRSQRGTP
jgi:hypothetical protein